MQLIREYQAEIKYLKQNKEKASQVDYLILQRFYHYAVLALCHFRCCYVIVCSVLQILILPSLHIYIIPSNHH